MFAHKNINRLGTPKDDLSIRKRKKEREKERRILSKKLNCEPFHFDISRFIFHSYRPMNKR